MATRSKSKQRSQVGKSSAIKSGRTVAGVPLEKVRELSLSSKHLEDLQKTLLRTPGQTFYIYNRQTQEFVLGEEESARLYGYTAAEIRALPEGWASLYHPEDKVWMLENADKIEELGPKSKALDYDARILRKDGRWEWVSIHRRPLEWDDDGRLLTELGMARVITREIEARERALESRRSYQALFDEAPMAIFLTDLSGTVIEANRTAHRDLGAAKGRLAKRPLPNLCATGHRRVLRDALRGARLEDRSDEPIVTRFVRDDESEFPAEVTVTSLPNERLLVMARDLSERESQLAAEEEKAKCYQGLFLENNSGVAVFDRHGHFLDANPSLVRLLGLSNEEFLSMRLADVVNASSRRAVATLVRQFSKPVQSSIGVELELISQKDGRVVPVEAFANGVFDSSGEFDRGVVTFNLTGERKEAEAALLRESQLTSVLLDNAPVAIALISTEGRVLRVNAMVEAMFGFKSAELKGKSIWELPLLDAGEVPKSRRRFRRVLEGKSSVRAVIPLSGADGELRLIEAETTAVRSGGRIDYLITTGLDITERRRLETEVIRVAEAEQIRIGHDLHDGVGQTLTGIGTLIGALEDDLEGQVKKDAARIRELVQEAIGENRRISHGLSPAAIKLRGLGGGLALLGETVRKNHRISCECHLDPKVRALPEEHAIHAYRIAQEAVSNAVRHGRATHIQLKMVDRGEGRCGLEIRDNGSGFRMSEAARKEGIGVRVMRHRADLIGAELHLRSAPGKGTKVVLELEV